MKKKLLTILLSVFVMMGTFSTRVFAASYNTIEDILNIATNIPEMSGDSIPDDAWTNGNGGYLVKMGNFIIFTDNTNSESSHKTTTVFDSGNGTYEYTAGKTVKFTITNDSLVSVTVSGLTNPYESLNGEYTAPVTIASILATNPDFPTSDSFTAPANAWVCNEGYKMFHKNNDLFFSLGSTAISDSIVLTKDDNNYTYSHTENPTYTLVFEMDSSGVLQKIHVNDAMGISSSDFVLEPIGNRKTLEMIVNTINDFPDSEEDGWVSDKGIKMYLDSGELNLVVDGSPTPMAYASSLFSPSGSNYVAYLESQEMTITANMNNGILESIGFLMEMPQDVPPDLIEMYEEMIQKVNGTYAPYKFVNETREITVGSTGEVSFKTNANYQEDPDNVIVKIQLEGEASPTELTYDTHYTLETGSTIVKLKGDYVKTLPLGTHTITIGVDGYSSVSQQFKIKTASSPTPTPEPSPDSSPRYAIPNTGVEGTLNNRSLLKLSSLSLLAIGTYIAIKKKKDN